MTDSEIYKEGSVTRTSNVNKRNAEIANKYQQEQRDKEIQDIAGIERENGIREGRDMAYLDVVNRLNAASQYTPIQQSNVDMFTANNNPNYGLLDEVERYAKNNQDNKTVAGIQASAFLNT